MNVTLSVNQNSNISHPLPLADKGSENKVSDQKVKDVALPVISFNAKSKVPGTPAGPFAAAATFVGGVVVGGALIAAGTVLAPVGVGVGLVAAGGVIIANTPVATVVAAGVPTP